MSSLSYRQIATALNGTLVGEDGVLSTVATDTRSLQGGELFIALKGDNFDAHDFIETAIEQGVQALLVERQMPVTQTQIIVADTRKALGGLARLWRQQFDIPLVAITGSNGKTTVKEMIAAIMSVKGHTLVTQGNLNNDIGVPLTLLRLNKEHHYAIIEMGANHPGEIAYLSNLALANIALITNAGPAHLEGFKSIAGVAAAKAEIYAPLSADGIAIVNADDEYAEFWYGKTQHCKRITFSLQQKDADVYGRWQAENKTLQVITSGAEVVLQLPLPGIHNAYNALAAVAATLHLDITLTEAKVGLEQHMQPVKGRLYPRRGVQGMHILDDTYNANPASLQAALEVIGHMPGEAWLVLGDMGELGSAAAEIHRDMGKLAKQYGVKRLFTYGELSAEAAQQFGERALAYQDASLLLAELLNAATSEVNVLVKGSRAMKMEKIVAGLLDDGVMYGKHDVVGGSS